MEMMCRYCTPIRMISFSFPTSIYMSCGEAVQMTTTATAIMAAEILKLSLNPLRFLSKFLAPVFCAVKTLNEVPRLTAGIVNIVSTL